MSPADTAAAAAAAEAAVGEALAAIVLPVSASLLAEASVRGEINGVSRAMFTMGVGAGCAAEAKGGCEERVVTAGVIDCT
jgi:hypothetical protein